MKYFITGISGHCAPHLAKLLLKEGHEVHALIRETSGRKYDLLDIMSIQEIDSIIWHFGDFTRLNTITPIFKNNRFDGCFHLGAASHPPTSFKYPLYTLESNVIGTANLAESIRLYNPECALCNISTSEVYGNDCKYVGTLTEDLPLHPSNPYGWSKMAAERFIRERSKNKFIKAFNTRAFSHLAPRRGKNFSISSDAYYLALIARGKKIDNILPIGNLQTQRVVIDARDVVVAYYLLMQKYHNIALDDSINGESYNVCGGLDRLHTMEFFTDMLIEISKLLNIKKVIDPKLYRKIDIDIQIGSTAKLLNIIDWSPIIPIEKTLADLFEYWYKKVK